MTEPMSKQRLKDLKEWGEARGPLLIIRELTDEIDRLREELRIEKDATCEACAKNYHENKRLRERCAALEKEHTKALKDWAASEKRNLTLREENERLRKTVDYLRVPEL